LFWLEMIEESEIVLAKRLSALKKEANELVAITVASINTAKSRVAAKSGVMSKRGRRSVPTSDFRLPTS